ncbi:MFS transporter [Robiginitomaculum antarcticum]|uniref:hypothetical protein n=1 Tax=Robiginitomaculum antarcticum TaxID=437507 RepID=UPI00036CD394|nr:hypothetical protein [Robiginitomaculum antarcticum]
MAKVSTRMALSAALKDRQVLAMLILGLASGLPYAAVGGTLNAWLTTVGVKPVAIGLLSWALLAYAFKFMWAAALQSHRTPFNLGVGPRRFWMSVFMLLVSAGLLVLALSNPAANLAFIGIVSILIAVASASLDIVVAAWRIEIARDDQHLDILSSVEQFGYRIASWVAGFVALILADHIGWRLTFFGLALVMALCLGGVALASRTPLTASGEKTATFIRQGGRLSARQRRIGTWLTLAGWVIGFYLIGDFMFGALTDPENHKASTFIRMQGPFVILSTVIWLGIVSAVLVWMNGRNSTDISGPVVAKSSVTDILYRAILEPMMELISRLRWVAVLVLMVVLSYRFTDLIWGGFAYPFYLGENYGALGHTLTEVGFASKFMGVIATIVGIALGGLAMLRFGRMPVFFFGAVLAAITNLLFADLALDARFTDSVLGFLHIDDVFALFSLDLRMARLTSVIFAENLAVGLASAASVAYLSSIVNKEYAAVQYALLVSLIMLLGVLGRPTIGEIIETQGFATAFIVCAGLGAVAAVLALIEWIRLSRHPKETAG